MPVNDCFGSDKMMENVKYQNIEIHIVDFDHMFQIVIMHEGLCRVGDGVSFNRWDEVHDRFAAIMGII